MGGARVSFVKRRFRASACMTTILDRAVPQRCSLSSPHPPMNTPRALLLAALLAPAVARANGRFPAAQFIVVGPGDAGRTLALRTTFGVVISDDGGARWSWLCEDAFGYGGRKLWDPPIALGDATADGTALLVGVPDGLWRDTNRCTPRRVTEIADYTGDITANVAGTSLLWASASAGRAATIFASDDGGRTWNRRLSSLPDVIFETVEAAESNPARVYLTGINTRDSATVLFRSDDGARTVTAVPLDLRGGRDAFIAGVHRGDADTLWLRVPVRDDDAGTDGTLLLRSTDGGRRFDVLHRTRGPMLGFAYSGDGRTLWIGGPADGLLRSDDGAPFRPVAELSVRCLRWHAGALYICQDHTVDGVALSRSRDGGATREAILRFSAIAGPPSACAASTPVRTVCGPAWPAVRRAVLDPDAGIAPDAAVAPAASADTGSCSAGHTRPGTPWGAVLALAMCLALSRNRARP